jgi:hypothetical protein
MNRRRALYPGASDTHSFACKVPPGRRCRAVRDYRFGLSPSWRLAPRCPGRLAFVDDRDRPGPAARLASSAACGGASRVPEPRLDAAPSVALISRSGRPAARAASPSSSSTEAAIEHTRGDELAKVVGRPIERPVSLTGPGGSYHRRLALECCGRVPATGRAAVRHATRRGWPGARRARRGGAPGRERASTFCSTRGAGRSRRARRLERVSAVEHLAQDFGHVAHVGDLLFALATADAANRL